MDTATAVHHVPGYWVSFTDRYWGDLHFTGEETGAEKGPMIYVPRE